MKPTRFIGTVSVIFIVTIVLTREPEGSSLLLQNKGEIPSDAVQYYARTADNTLYFLEDAIILDLSADPANQEQNGKNENDQPIIRNKRINRINASKTGNVLIKAQCVNGHPSNVIANTQTADSDTPWNNSLNPGVSVYPEINYNEIYDLIDLKYVILPHKLKYQFEVHAGGNPDEIQRR